MCLLAVGKRKINGQTVTVNIHEFRLEQIIRNPKGSQPPILGSTTLKTPTCLLRIHFVSLAESIFILARYYYKFSISFHYIIHN